MLRGGGPITNFMFASRRSASARVAATIALADVAAASLGASADPTSTPCNSAEQAVSPCAAGPSAAAGTPVPDVQTAAAVGDCAAAVPVAIAIAVAVERMMRTSRSTGCPRADPSTPEGEATIKPIPPTGGEVGAVKLEEAFADPDTVAGMHRGRRRQDDFALDAAVGAGDHDFPLVGAIGEVPGRCDGVHHRQP